MEPNKLFHDRYFLERLLGRGNFSEVWLAKDTKTDIQVALKIYAPATGLDDAGLNVLAREFSLVVNANHKNLLKPLYYDSFERKPYLVLPYCKAGSIMKLVCKFTEEDAWRLLRDVSSGLAWLHGMTPPIIHQDIKPDNIMISDNGDFMITDFGVSTHVKSTLRKSMSAAFSSAGTIAYMAPERFSKDSNPIMANDIYSLGATVFEMLSGDTPFGDDGGLLQKKGADVPDLKGNYSEQLKKVLTKCLALNPWERPTAEQLEKYAECGLKGVNIKFEDEQTFFERYRKIIVAVAIVGFIAVSAGIYIVKHHADTQSAIRLAEQMEMRNDSIQTIIASQMLVGDSLVAIGDLHEEGFENEYLKAFENYSQAKEKGQELSNGVSIMNEEELIKKSEQVRMKLYEAYLSFQEKAKLFEDDIEIATEFKDRATRIQEIVDFSGLHSQIVPQVYADSLSNNG